ncbi:hypothetical protein AJ80_03259 [Polytolypa hystricis UAMH7299]|uniref:Cyanovirin-N domain-containing protein n=1 Tax=Polytolypa hystricis (strain UAMH7299) TaxID=1447883 RepID=A0A2B7YKV2_POLH7|nr:hypothetical protein AJ80_03259 [Polytolypa hystricis UAMH7299]
MFSKFAKLALLTLSLSTTISAQADPGIIFKTYGDAACGQGIVNAKIRILDSCINIETMPWSSFSVVMDGDAAAAPNLKCSENQQLVVRIFDKADCQGNTLGNAPVLGEQKCEDIEESTVMAASVKAVCEAVQESE